VNNKLKNSFSARKNRTRLMINLASSGFQKIPLSASRSKVRGPMSAVSWDNEVKLSKGLFQIKHSLYDAGKVKNLTQKNHFLAASTSPQHPFPTARSTL
jgi:hypothetical protein